MKLVSTRTLDQLRPVLKDPQSQGPDPVYWVFSDITESRWENLTVIAEGKISPSTGSTGSLRVNSGQAEYPKTFGHYHTHPVGEVYHLVAGEGILMLQKKFLENDQWIPEKVAEVILIKALPGDEICITPEWGHSWSNIGDLPLLTFDDWREGHTPRDYEAIKKLKGLAYYLVEDPSASTSAVSSVPNGSGQGMVKAVPNPNYQDLPEPVWLTAEEFKKRQLKIDSGDLTSNPD